MKKLIRIILVTAGIFLILLIVFTGKVDNTPYLESGYFRQTLLRADSIAAATRTGSDTLYAGFSSVSITPCLGTGTENPAEGSFSSVPLAGYGDRKGKPATGIHDSVFVKAVALRSGNRLLVIVGADLLIMPPNIADTAAALLSHSGINRDQLFFTATHSHSSLGGWGPGYLGKQFAGDENRNLEKWLSARIALAVTEAVARLRPAGVTTGSFRADLYTRNRLVGENGTKNNDFSYIILSTDDGRKAVIGSFSAHATTLGDDNMEISADYPGFWARKTMEYGYDLAMFCAGSVGSQSPAGEGGAFGKAGFIGEGLADSLKRHSSLDNMERTPFFSCAALRIELPEYHIRLSSHRNLSTWLSSKLMQKPHNVLIQALRLGNLVWITVPADFSGEYAVQIKNSLAVKGFTANISSFNGNYIGYIIPGKYFYMDEYESRIMGWFGPSMGDYAVDLIERMAAIVSSPEKM